MVLLTAPPDSLPSIRAGSFFDKPSTKLNGQPPAEADMGRHFRVSPPTIHDMILLLEKKKLLVHEPGVPCSIRELVPPEQLPPLV